jgi:DNA-binding CsgD family transcriptional regulator
VHPNLPQFSQLLLTLYRSAQEAPVHQFQDAALDAVQPVLHFDASIWGTGTMTPQGIDIHSLHRRNFPDDMLASFERVRHQDTAARRVTSQPRQTIGFAAEEEFRGDDQAEIRQFAHDYASHHCLLTSDIHPLTRFAQWVSLFRSDPQQRCTPAEIEFLHALAPHLMQSLAINRLVHLDRMVGDAARESWVVAIADTRGVIYHADPRWRDLVAREWPADSRDRVCDELLQRLRGEEGRILGMRVVVQRTTEQGLFFLRARERHPVDSLSPREFIVAEMLAGGLTQKQIAARLDRSPETIRSQVKAIFAKMAINNVTLLAPLLVLRQ